jgi:serine/threonine protein phosphatase PrpC
VFAEERPAVEARPAPPPPRTCPQCQAPRGEAQTFCFDCGWVFPPDDAEATAIPAPAPQQPTKILQSRYELGALISQRSEVARFRGRDLNAADGEPTPVTILRALQAPAAEPVLSAEEVTETAAEAIEAAEILPTFEEAALAQSPDGGASQPDAAWPSIAWERALLESRSQPSLPRILDRFDEEGFEYLVEEVPAGRALWDAWDDPATTNAERYGWLQQLAETLRHLHRAGAILEFFRPEFFIVTAGGQVRFTDLGNLLPLPLPPDVPLHGSLYTAPELMASGAQADARTSLYSFGAMLYSLLVGRELAEADFDRHGFPKPFMSSFPDVHPALGRLIAKTFCRDVDGRFPTEDAQKEDASGFSELIHTLGVCGRVLDQVRLDLAAWTTTGMVRTGNEDACAVLHAVEARQDELTESALLLLADGMGGSDAGEVAAALALEVLRQQLWPEGGFASLEAGEERIAAALREANKQVLEAARTGKGKRGMGCTAEVVAIRGGHFIIGHVGDSRTYLLHEGELTQLTRDQTLVNRLVELGTLTPEEAEAHPRRSELQQAIGGRADVEPALYRGRQKPGDWLVVCSDGLTNHVTADELKQMLQVEATSAEMAARRLVNFANLRGANDNVTVIVARVT